MIPLIININETPVIQYTVLYKMSSDCMIINAYLKKNIIREVESIIACQTECVFPYLITTSYADTSILNFYFRLKDVPGRHELWFMLGFILAFSMLYVSFISMLNWSLALIAQCDCKMEF